MRVLPSVAVICAGVLTACAAPGSNRSVSVSLNAAPEFAVCDVSQNGASVASDVPGRSSVKIPSSGAPVTFRCIAPGHETLITEVVAAAFQSPDGGPARTAAVRLSLKPAEANAATQVDCGVAGFSLKMSAGDCQKMAGAEVERYYEAPLVQEASLEWSGVMPSDWRATGRPLTLINITD